MKHIRKGAPLADFTDFVQNECPINWGCIHNSKRHPNIYDDCRDEILIKEQDGLGGYTERPLLGNTKLHIDHYRKKGLNWSKDVSFNWDNLIVEERSSNYGACYKDKFTQDTQDYTRMLNPVEHYPERLISYFTNGVMVAKSGISKEEFDCVNFTIERFNLNHKFLVSEREMIIKYVIEDYRCLSDDEIRTALKDCGYPTVVEWALGIRKDTLF
jgi:uncharacterized protein (TIGR02646 family)